MRSKLVRIIHLIIFTPFKQQLQFVIRISLLTRTSAQPLSLYLYSYYSIKLSYQKQFSQKFMWHLSEPRGLSISSTFLNILGLISKFGTWYCVPGLLYAVSTMLQTLSYHINIIYSHQGPQNILLVFLPYLNPHETVVYQIPLSSKRFHSFICW